LKEHLLRAFAPRGKGRFFGGPPLLHHPADPRAALEVSFRGGATFLFPTSPTQYDGDDDSRAGAREGDFEVVETEIPEPGKARFRVVLDVAGL
jgi:hypothetical protein